MITRILRAKQHGTEHGYLIFKVDMDMEAELVFDTEASPAVRALDEAEQTAQLDAVPDDCAFGDGGASAAIISSDSSAKSSSSGLKKQPKQRATTKLLQSEDSFASMLAGTERCFSVGESGCVVRIDPSVTEESKRTIATIYTDDTCTSRVGYVSTAEPLGTTSGLKASCTLAEHKEKHKSPCSCWVAFGKAKCPTAAERLDLFKSLCEWISAGVGVNRASHDEASLTLRIAAGMKPRTGK